MRTADRPGSFLIRPSLFLYVEDGVRKLMVATKGAWARRRLDNLAAAAAWPALPPVLLPTSDTMSSIRNLGYNLATAAERAAAPGGVDMTACWAASLPGWT